MSDVMRLGYVHLRVTDLEEARNHYSNTLGMEVVHEEPGKLYLKCWDEWDHHSLVLEEGGVGLVKLGYKVESPEAMADFEQRAQQFGATTGRFSAGENLTVGEGVRITLPSEHNIELYTEMEFAGTETGAINPEAWPREPARRRHALDRPRPDAARGPGPGRAVPEEVLDFKTAERVVTSMDEPEVHRHLDVVWGVAARHRVHQGPQRQAAPLRLPPGGLELRSCGPATSSRWTTCRSTSARPGTASPGARRSTSSTRRVTATRCSPGWATGCSTTSRPINWTVDQLAKGIFYQRELNDAFTSVWT